MLTLTQTLQEAGLSPREASLYQELLKLGEVSIAKLQRSLGLHPQVAYRAVDNLVRKGLAHELQKRGRRYVRAETPTVLLEAGKKKVVDLERAMPALLRMQRSPEQTLVRVGRGNDAVRRLRGAAVETLEPGDILYVMGGSSERFYAAMGQELALIEEHRVRKKVRRKLLSYESQRIPLLKQDTEKILTEFRFLKGQLVSPASTLIFGNFVGILVWADEPITITLESKEVSASYRQFFNSLWRTAEK